MGMTSTSAVMLLALRLHVVAEQCILVADVQFAVGNYRVGPCRIVATVGLLEAASLDVFLPVWLDQEDRPFLGAIVDPAVRQGDRSFRNPAFVGIALVPED